MPMAVLALIVLVAWLGLVTGVRGYLHGRRTGTMAIPTRATPGSPAWWAKLLASVGDALAFATPIAELLGFSPLASLDGSIIRTRRYAAATGCFVSFIGRIPWRPGS